MVEKHTLDYRIINSETGIKYIAEYDYILKREKKGNYNGHVELHQAGRNGYETSEEDKNGHEIWYQARLWILIQQIQVDYTIHRQFKMFEIAWCTFVASQK